MWVKGQSGNPEGNPKSKRFYAALDRAILQDDGKRLRAAAEKMLDLAAGGEQWAVLALADRLDGKVPQAITGEDGGPMVIKIIAFNGDGDAGNNATG